MGSWQVCKYHWESKKRKKEKEKNKQKTHKVQQDKQGIIESQTKKVFNTSAMMWHWSCSLHFSITIYPRQWWNGLNQVSRSPSHTWPNPDSKPNKCRHDGIWKNIQELIFNSLRTQEKRIFPLNFSVISSLFEARVPDVNRVHPNTWDVNRKPRMTSI